MILKKKLKARMKKKKKKEKEKKEGKEEQSVVLWHWTGQKNVWLLRHDVQRHMLCN